MDAKVGTNVRGLVPGLVLDLDRLASIVATSVATSRFKKNVYELPEI
jgi:hypothetical protein